jgi:phospholipid/cholesterol/gamma-HCH transport system substrate-binding protein
MQVGAFTLIGLAVLVISILLLGGNKVLFQGTYTLKVHFDQVQGLAKGSVVSLNGYPVGNVEKISFLPESNFLEVVLGINDDFRGRITEGSEASVKTQGALGDKYVYITPGPVNASPLPSGGLLKAGETADFIDQIASESEKLSNVGDVIQELNILLKNLNHDNNSQKLVKNLADGGRSLEEFFDKAQGETLIRLNSILTKIDNGQGTLGELINDPALHKKVMGFFGESKRNEFLSPLLQQVK